MGHKERPQYELPEEVRIVIECSPNLMPLQKVPARQHLPLHRADEERQVPAVHRVVRQTDKELKTIRLLKRWRMHRDN
jgi:hypothetical protein